MRPSRQSGVRQSQSTRRAAVASLPVPYVPSRTYRSAACLSEVTKYVMALLPEPLALRFPDGRVGEAFLRNPGWPVAGCRRDSLRLSP